ncbi:hypothetical protein H9N28_03290 [Rhodobacter capsulatus]|uniref:hypothetical protein n=1 Tax=Rhodobacter capsulatus TaxID=1061 RepID=UPI0006DC02DA|nr:hypothetical protein [Rhodobacter capsulatus]KQB15310.1 hypothetical protein AP073_14690 [Rhodobacter capsulatus]KQB16120.1 hypothetical protein AP071_13195 [Rhodobacter capsulatus]PZX25566.1 hypothetical protein LY44_01349 [Rhodobacter capsulatus]QNR63875.1 hypothetical protein H9N28_03290 [Rhodobacter capsulatus]
MTAHKSPHEFVGIGLYTIDEAAKLLKSPTRTVRRWLLGHDFKARNGETRHSPPLWATDLPHADGAAELSFRDLVELRFVRAFVEMGLDIRIVRSCLETARECIQSDRPFSSGRFRTDGKRIFLQSLEQDDTPVLIDLKRKQFVFHQIVERTFKDLDLEDDIVTRWRPFHGRASIVVDPKRAFGQPIAAESGVPTIVLAEAVVAEGSVTRVAALYEVDRAAVQDAVTFHKELAAA